MRTSLQARVRGLRGTTLVAPPAGGGQPPTIFNSDFGFATGTSTAALRDDTTWNASIGGATGMSVVTGHGKAFPSPNVLRMLSPYPGTAAFHRLYVATLPLLSDGNSRFYRAYIAPDMPFTGVDDHSTHPIESGQVGGLDWALNVEVVSDTAWYISFQAPGEALGGLFWRQRWRCPDLVRGEVYRVDWQVKQLPNTTVGVAPTSRKTMELHARVHHCTLSGSDVIETLLHSDADFTNRDGSDGVSAGSVSMESNTQLLMSTTDGANMNELRVGNNGLTGVYPDGIHIGDQTAIAVSDVDFVGPYSGGI